MTSACGICGQANLDALAARGYTRLPPGGRIAATVLHTLPGLIRSRQRLFEKTGGLHAAAVCTPDGEILVVREDIGRHNAVDKIVGWALLDGRLPLRDAIVVVSGRAGYEIVQKCVAAGVPILGAVSAPSSLAVDAAVEFDLTLVGFLRDDRFNVYNGIDRISMETSGLT
jgi:FdhD protein